MGRTSHFIITFLTVAFLGISSNTLAYVYVVREGDKFSKVLGVNVPGPVWGKSGSYQKFLGENPQIKNPNLIFPGDHINLPVEAPVVEEPARSLADSGNVPGYPADEKPIERTTDSSGTALDLSPFFSMTSLASTDAITGARATVASSVYTGADARYQQIWSERFKSYLRMKLAYVSFEAPNNASKSLLEKTKFLPTFGIGGVAELSSRFRAGISFYLEKDLFVRGISTTSITVDDVLIPSLGVTIGADLIQLEAFTVNAELDAQEKFPATTDSYAVKSGTSFGGILGVTEHLRGEDRFEVGFGAFSRTQNTSATNQTEILYTMFLRFHFPLTRPETTKGGNP